MGPLLPSRTRRPGALRRAFTLTEVTVSLVIVVLLSTVALTTVSRITPATDNPAKAALTAFAQFQTENGRGPTGPLTADQLNNSTYDRGSITFTTGPSTDPTLVSVEVLGSRAVGAVVAGADCWAVSIDYSPTPLSPPTWWFILTGTATCTAEGLAALDHPGGGTGRTIDAPTRIEPPAGYGSASAVTAPTAPTITSTTVGALVVTVRFAVTSRPTRPVTTIKAYRNGTLVATLPGTATSYQYTDLVNGTSYTLGLKASNSAGDSPIAATTVTASAIPAAPTGLTVARVDGSTTSLTLTWTPPTGTVSGYQVFRSTNSTFQKIAEPADSSYTDTGLTAGTVYTYKVSALNTLGVGPASEPVTGTTITVPDTPTITSTTRTDLTVTINFTAPASPAKPVTAVKVTRDGTVVDTLSGNATSYQYTGLVDGQSYVFGVKTTNAAGDSAAATVTLTARTTPAIPTGLTVAPVPGTPTALDLSWNPVTNTDVIGYNIYQLNQAGTLYELAGTVASPSFRAVGLTAGTSYSFKVAAYNELLEGGQTSPASGTPIDTPNTPTIGTVTRGDLSVTMNFTVAATSAKPVTGIKVYRDGTLVTTLAANATSYQFTGLVNGQSYVFGAAASNAVGNSTTSTTSSVTARTIPSAPTGLTVALVSASNTSLDLSWNAVTNTGITGYAVYQLNTVSGLYEFVTNNASTTYRRTGLIAGTTYSFKVAAYSDVTEGAQSSAASGTPIAAPDAPTIGSTSRGDLSVTMNFTVSATAAKPVTGIKVYRDGTLVTTLAANATSYQFTGLVNGQSYVFGAATTNAVGDSVTSTTTVTARTVPATPTGLAVSLVSGSSTSLDLSWNAVTNTGITGYAVYQLNQAGTLYVFVTNTVSTSYRVTGLTAGTTYSFKVAAYNDVTEGAQSSAASGTPAAEPAAPTITSVTGGDAQLSIAFTAGSDNGSAITTYEYSTDNGASWATRPTGTTASPIVISVPSDSGFPPTLLANGTTYTVRIRAVNAIGSGTPSASSTGTPAWTPAAPTITSITGAKNGPLSVAFTAGSDNGSAITNYEYSTDNGATWTTRSPAATTSPISISGVNTTTMYTVRIRAVNGLGSGDASPLAASPTLTTPGGATDDLVYCVTVADCSGLTTAANGTGYQLAFSAVAGAWYRFDTYTVDANSTSWTTGTLANGNSSFLGAVNGSTGQRNGSGEGNFYYQQATATGTSVINVGAPINQAVFFRITRVSDPTLSDRPYSALSAPVYTDVLGVYTTVGTTSFRAPAAGTLDFLVIGGGGGGGASSTTVQYYGGGGGGAGGYRTSVTGATSGRGSSAESKVTVSAGSVYTVTVGSAGPSYGNAISGASRGTDGGNGGASVFGSITATGGGGGGAGGRAGLAGGAGGGAGGCGPRSGGSGTASQGYDGGSNTGCSTGNEHRGGGGAGSSTTTHTGGSGLASSITGTSVTRATGGIGGGAGSNWGNSGAANSGGGGAGTAAGTIAVAGTGGSGIVIIRWQR